MATTNSPGSLNQYRDEHPGLCEAVQLTCFEQDLAEHRQSLADERNVTPEELHEDFRKTTQTIGQLSLL